MPSSNNVLLGVFCVQWNWGHVVTTIIALFVSSYSIIWLSQLQLEVQCSWWTFVYTTCNVIATVECIVVLQPRQLKLVITLLLNILKHSAKMIVRRPWTCHQHWLFRPFDYFKFQNWSSLYLYEDMFNFRIILVE